MHLGETVEVMNYDISPDESVSQAVVSGVSKFEDTAFTDLPSLYETIDPDALNKMFIDENANIKLSFSYSNSLVVVCDGESLRVEAT
jgi:hypothetical protein